MPHFHLRFPLSDIPKYADDYRREALKQPEEWNLEEKIIDEIAPAIRGQQFLTQEQLAAICYWKSRRSKSYVSRNDPAYTEAVTRIALTTDNDRLRIEVLLLLSGVQWPTASTILHFCYDNLYPILDVRALWSAGVDDVTTVVHNYSLWQQYTAFCRETAAQADVTLRTLDRALWQYRAPTPS